MEDWSRNFLARLGETFRGRQHAELEVALPDEPSRPRWDPTTKVVVGVLLFVTSVIAIYAARVVLVPLIIGVILAYLLQPVVRLIQRVLRLPHGIAAGLVYLALLALIIPIGALLIPVIIEQIIFTQRQVIGFARYLNDLGAESTVEVLGFNLEVQEVVRQITSALTDFMTSVATASVSFVFDAARIILLVVFTFVIGFYLTRDADNVLKWASGLTPPSYRADVDALMTEIDGVWSAFFRGQVLLSLIVAIILTVMSVALGLPEPFLLGVWGGLLEFLPSIGNMIWGITVVIIALVTGSTYLPVPNAIFALIVLGAYVAFAQLDMNVLIPNIIGRQVRLHPVVVIMGVIIGASIGGVIGVALAAPTIASLRVIFRYIYAKLFDLDPFPMVGAPSAPRPEREAELERIATLTTTVAPAEQIRNPSSVTERSEG
jgi:predicted PurR-regulated permease PerM